MRAAFEKLSLGKSGDATPSTSGQVPAAGSKTRTRDRLRDALGIGPRSRPELAATNTAPSVSTEAADRAPRAALPGSDPSSPRASHEILGGNPPSLPTIEIPAVAVDEASGPRPSTELRPQNLASLAVEIPEHPSLSPFAERFEPSSPLASTPSTVRSKRRAAALTLVSDAIDKIRTELDAFDRWESKKLAEATVQTLLVQQADLRHQLDVIALTKEADPAKVIELTGLCERLESQRDMYDNDPVKWNAVDQQWDQAAFELAATQARLETYPEQEERFKAVLQKCEFKLNLLRSSAARQVGEEEPVGDRRELETNLAKLIEDLPPGRRRPLRSQQGEPSEGGRSSITAPDPSDSEGKQPIR